MMAYKAFGKGLVCRGYKFHMGLNKTQKAQTAECGFHCAENPLDCLSYYGNMDTADYYVVDAGGDINEDGNDSKIACTELTIIKKLTRQEFFLHALAFMVDHPKRKQGSHVQRNTGDAGYKGYVVVRGIDPIAKGQKGAVIALAKESSEGIITEIAVTTVDGTKVKPDTWYGIDLQERQAKGR